MIDEPERNPGSQSVRTAGRGRALRRWAAIAVFGVAVAGAASYVFRPVTPDEAGQPAGEPKRDSPHAGATDAGAANAAAAGGAYGIGDKLASAGAVAGAGTAGQGGLREIEWDALLPKGWDPLAPLKNLKLDELADDDPRAQQALAKAMEHWKRAPVEPALDGAAVRIPGFVVSLGGEGEALREFLLVPYFGACIHVPPPPANQVIHVRLDEPTRAFRTMDPVWISGVIRVERAETMMGDSGYAMASAKVEAYVAPERESLGR